jgi:arginine utilization regulatory protein
MLSDIMRGENCACYQPHQMEVLGVNSRRDAEQDWLIHILDTIDEGIHAVDVDGVTIFYNAAAGRMDGLAPSDVIGKHVLAAFPSLENETSTLLQVLKTGRAIHDQPQIYTNYLGVKVHTVNTTLPIVSGGKVVGALEVAKDLTQVRRLTEQVLELQAQVVGDRRKGQLQRKHRGPSNAVYRFSHVLTQDARMMQLKQRAERAAKTSSPILVYGETGTGKELLVQAIHHESPRHSAPFMALNCAALPGTLLEGILFGTVRGSFTGAEDRPGLFELADEGTLFLDEIQSMPMELQAKLLRVLQEGELMRVGDTRIRRVNVRVIAAMNVAPEAAVQAGQLRQDLYFRINVVRFDIPPLRERTGDIRFLTEHFIDKWNKQFGTHVTGVTAEVRKLFQQYPWPGNVRELENAIEAALNMIHSGLIDVDALPGHLRNWLQKQQGQSDARRAENSAGSHHPSSSHPTYLEWADILVTEGMNEFWQSLGSGLDPGVPWRGLQVAFERMVLQRTLSALGGNVKAAAKHLGMPRQTLQYRIKQLGL